MTKCEPEAKRYRGISPERQRKSVESAHEQWRRPLSQPERRRKLREDKIKESMERQKCPPKPPLTPRPTPPEPCEEKENCVFHQDEEPPELNMVGAVEDLWQTLMNDQAQHLKAIGGDLSDLADRKQDVQGAQESLAQAEIKCDVAYEHLMDKKNELNDLCSRLLQAGSGEINRTWREGELCFRKDILCTILRAFYDEDPPYFEVQGLHTPRTIVGTDHTIMLVPAPFQQGSLRQKLREVDTAKDSFKQAELDLAGARLKLRDAHDEVVKAHKLAQIHEEEDEEPEILPAPSDFSGAPPGMPDMALVQKWTGPLQDIPEDSANETWNTFSEYEEYATEEGEVYYYNVSTGETTWSAPQGRRMPGAKSYDQYGGDQDGFTEGATMGKTFTDLSYQAEQQAAERDAWQKWYQDYTSWYQSNLPREEANSFGRPDPQPSANILPPKEESKKTPPVPLVSNFKDRATHAVVVAIHKEMMNMMYRKVSVAERRRALRELHRHWHPDKNPDKAEIATNVFQFVEDCKSWFLEDDDNG